LGLLSINALVASDNLIIPVNPAYFSVKGIKNLISTFTLVKDNLKPDLSILGVLITMYHSGKSLSKEISTAVKEAFGDTTFKTVIRVNTTIEKAQDKQIPVVYYEPNSRGYEDYMALAEEVIAHEQ
jgi:chromosome partitioning protein